MGFLAADWSISSSEWPCCCNKNQNTHGTCICSMRILVGCGKYQCHAAGSGWHCCSKGRTFSLLWSYHPFIVCHWLIVKSLIVIGHCQWTGHGMYYTLTNLILISRENKRQVLFLRCRLKDFLSFMRLSQSTGISAALTMVMTGRTGKLQN